MRKIIDIPNSVFCERCYCYFSYEDSDVIEIDERKRGTGHSLFWLVECPDCGEELVVIPNNYIDKAEQRRKEILGSLRK